MKNVFVILYLVLFFSTLDAQIVSGEVDALKKIRTNLEFIASDELEGRESTTMGETISSLYIAKELESYGVKPFGDDGTYFQNFEVDIRWVDESSTVTFIADDGETELKLGDDFLLSKDPMPGKAFSGKNYEIVFTGYGITANSYGYDDYANIDVSGKVVLIFRDAPLFEGEKVFSDEDHETYSETNYKIETAVENGASGILFLPRTSLSKYWRWIKHRAISSSFKLVGNEVDENEVTIPIILLSLETAADLLSGDKFSFQEISKEVDNGELPKPFLLNKTVKLDYKTCNQIRTSRNILGIIEGTDEELLDEYVTFGAHYDHVGVMEGEIYNGADDNGSGTVAILEAARRMSLLKENRRSILVIFHAAEEKGLLGSKYLTGNSDFMDDLVVNINVDMVGRESIDSIFCIGSDMLSTELYELVQKVNDETVDFVLDYTFDDPNDPNRYYYRSDHYNYAKHNIPIVFFYDHMLEDYHKPSDDVEKINFKKIEKISTLITELALRISNLDHRLKVDKLEVESIE
ncbi:MAG: M20/M25/M40 family metallo-hydrolase [Ignavibacteria bacterium]|nr:M20/M25/M40 family metallo-hydrolase [Ignavibacteria bacterium]